MTRKEAIIQISFIKNFGYPQDIAMLSKEVDGDEYKALKMAIEELEKADKYRWHNIKDNPEDFPNKSGLYECYGEWGSSKKAQESNVEYSVEDGYFRVAWNFNVIAWREIDYYDTI